MPGPGLDRHAATRGDAATTGQREDEVGEVDRPVDPSGREDLDLRADDAGEDDPYASDPLDEWTRGGRGSSFDAGEDDRAWREDAAGTGDGDRGGDPAPVGPATGGIVGALPGF